MAAVKALRAMLAEKDKIVVCPGVLDGFTARIALAAGFDCLYMTGAGTTMSRLGMADLGIATLNDMRDHANMIASLDRSIPLIADADTGYGGPIMVGRTVEQYIQAGVAGMHLEDQVVNKRCGHLKNKELVPEEVYFSRIRAAVNARAASQGDIVLIARTDALASLGLEASLARLKGAIEIGVDVAFLEGIHSKEEAEYAIKELAPTPVLLNMVAGGVTPHFSVEEARQTGFRIIIYPAFAMEPIYESVSKQARILKETGDLPSSSTELLGPRRLFEVCGLRESMEFDVKAGGTMYDGGV